ncbi:3-isopropylmalate dehydratase small subunit [Pseudomonas putida S11]|nr:3-isopropylmalate dehydratase small subunit [Pseudomonas putida S11]
MKALELCWLVVTLVVVLAVNMRLGLCMNGELGRLLHRALLKFFYSNCFKNGILPIVLDEVAVENLFVAVEQLPGYQISIDLEKQEIVDGHGNRVPFDVDPFRKHCLLNGLDEVGMTLLKAGAIREFEKTRIVLEPWLYERF